MHTHDPPSSERCVRGHSRPGNPRRWQWTPSRKPIGGVKFNPLVERGSLTEALTNGATGIQMARLHQASGRENEHGPSRDVLQKEVESWKQEVQEYHLDNKHKKNRRRTEIRIKLQEC